MTLKTLANSVEKVQMLKAQLRGPERDLALRQIASLSVEEKRALFPEWVHLARAAHAPFQLAWDVIESLPRDWVLQNIPKEVETILEDEDETDYWMFLQLYARLDRALMRGLAQRAAAHSDAEIRELGRDYLAK